MKRQVYSDFLAIYLPLLGLVVNFIFPSFAICSAMVTVRTPSFTVPKCTQSVEDRNGGSRKCSKCGKTQVYKYGKSKNEEQRYHCHAEGCPGQSIATNIATILKSFIKGIAAGSVKG